MSKYHNVLTSGYSTQSGTDPRATGGVTHTEIARGTAGLRVRCVDSNGRFVSAGKSRPIDTTEARALIDRAASRGANNGGLSKAAADKLRKTLRLA